MACSTGSPAGSHRGIWGRSGSFRAFTLTELLVALAIVGVLALILASATSGVVARGRATRCQNNLRQLYSACTLYAADNDGLLPTGDGGQCFPLGSSAPPGDPIRFLESYLRAPDAIRFCPSDPFAGQSVTTVCLNHRSSSYVFKGGGHRRGAATFAVPLDLYSGSRRQYGPPLHVLFTDNAWDCRTNTAWRDTSTYSHARRYLAVYFDGHAGSFGLQDEACRDGRSGMGF